MTLARILVAGVLATVFIGAVNGRVPWAEAFLAIAVGVLNWLLWEWGYAAQKRPAG